MFQQKQYRDKSLINFNKNYFFTNEMNFIIKRIYIMSISGNLALHIYPLIGKLRRYFFSRKIFKPELPKEKYKHLKRNKENFKVKEDGTYDMHSHQKISFTAGYQVSFETNDDNYSSKEYDEIAYKMSLISDNHIYLGVYNGVPEMSFYFNDYELANAISMIFNQNSIWDWSKNDEIKNIYHTEKDKGSKML
jgi:hypothetical protein